jgi:transposase
MGTSAGIDWAKSTHAVCIVDADGRRLAQHVVSHDEAGLRRVIVLLQRYAVQRVAIERPEGVLVERVLEAGFAVMFVPPNHMRAARDRYRVGRSKSDAFDAFVLAELARTDGHRFRCIEPDSDATRGLRAQTRAHEDLVRMRVAMTNRLRAELERCWPGPVGLFSDLDSQISLAFLAAYPSPQDAAKLTAAQLKRFLGRQHYSGRRAPTALLAHLAAAPQVTLAPAEVAARRNLVLGLVTILTPLVAQIRELDRAITHALRAHPDGHVFRSLFQSDDAFTAAALLAEIGDSRDRYPDPEALASDAGQTPVSVQSGKYRGVVFRRACDKRLRQAVGVLANSSRHHNPWAADIYHRAIDRGCKHQHALRILGRAWIRVLWRCWHDNQPYDPTRHGGRQRLLNT